MNEKKEDYKEMYFKLFNRISDIIEELSAIQQETEEMFITQESEKGSVES